MAKPLTITPIVSAAHQWSQALDKNNPQWLAAAFDHLLAATIEDDSLAGAFLFSPENYNHWAEIFG